MQTPPLNLDDRRKRSQGRLNRTKNFQARFSVEEEALFKATAKKHGMFLSEWVRESLPAAAEPVKREVEPKPIELFGTRGASAGD